jgi:hypothetical protein
VAHWPTRLNHRPVSLAHCSTALVLGSHRLRYGSTSLTTGRTGSTLLLPAASGTHPLPRPFQHLNQLLRRQGITERVEQPEHSKPLPKLIQALRIGRKNQQRIWRDHGDLAQQLQTCVIRQLVARDDDIELVLLQLRQADIAAGGGNEVAVRPECGGDGRQQ